MATEVTVSVELAMPEPKTARWTRRHLLGLEDLNRSELETILEDTGWKLVPLRWQPSRSIVFSKLA